MELTGNIANIKRDVFTNRLELTLEINEKDVLEESYAELKMADLLDIKISKHRTKRSLNANAYFHLLIGKLADRLQISKPRCKNMMLGRYGQPLCIDENGLQPYLIIINAPLDAVMESDLNHCTPCDHTTVDGVERIIYKIIRGSHTYNTKEMSILISGVVEECKEQGIETLTPTELQRMLDAWKPNKR
ncbi:MAG: hypothetical protein Q4B26_11115 [Eubacteriales bacterium]|nr:hypothetical protein [Eubacteriales bacterium]